MSDDERPVAWLRSQITARMDAARKAAPGPWEPEGDDPIDDQVIDPDGWTLAHMRGPKSYGNMFHVALNDPQDTIARCEAELAILDLHQPVRALRDPPHHSLASVDTWLECQECGPNNDQSLILAAPGQGEAFWPCQTVRLLASGYKHRPGYAEVWPPTSG